MSEKFLDDNIISQVRDYLDQMVNPVEIALFTKKEGCRSCEDTKQLMEEIVAISNKLSLILYDFDQDKEKAKELKVDKTPMIVLLAKNGSQVKDYGLRYAGLPGGHEFGTFINDIVFVSKSETSLSSTMKDFLRSLTKPVKMLVFFTPSCPHCPRAVSLAHQMAIESPIVEAEAIAANDFYELSNEYDVTGVPHTAILGSDNHLIHTVIGGVPETYLLEELKSKLQ